MTRLFDAKWLEEQKKKLLAHKIEVLNGLSSIGEEEQTPPQATESAEQSAVQYEEDVQLELKSRDMQRLQEIEIALGKIAQGEYGICEESEEFIDKKRLESIPWARYTCRVQEEIEGEKEPHSIAG